MRKQLLVLVTCVLACVGLVGNTGDAAAQNYPGSHQLRFGLYGQGSFTNVDVVETPLVGPQLSGTADGSHLGIGGSFGFDLWQYSGLVLGVEGDWTYIGGDGSFGTATYVSDWLATLRGRLGFLASPNTLIYGTAGVAWLGVTGEHPAVNLRDEVFTLTGWTIGGGLEYRWQGLALFGEYLYAQFDDWSYTTGSPPVGPRTYAGDADAHYLRFGVKFIIGEDHDWGRFYK